MRAKITGGVIVLFIFGLLLVSSSLAEGKKEVQTKYGIFKQVKAKGHEACYVADVGNGVLTVIMYGEDGPVEGKPIAMELAFTKDAWDKLPERDKPEGAK